MKVANEIIEENYMVAKTRSFNKVFNVKQER